MLDAQEEAKAIRRKNENPFAALQEGFAGGYGNAATYSRYEIAAAWNSIKARIADDFDFTFSVALNDTVLETGNLQETPFPIMLTYVGDTANSDNWGIRQMEEHPEYLDRLKQILEDRLQTPVVLSIQSRAYTESELHLKRQAQLSPFELDKQNDPNLKRLIDVFNAELIFSTKMKKQVVEKQPDEQIQDQEKD